MAPYIRENSPLLGTHSLVLQLLLKTKFLPFDLLLKDMDDLRAQRAIMFFRHGLQAGKKVIRNIAHMKRCHAGNLFFQALAAIDA
jgi:hypothetical protein